MGNPAFGVFSRLTADTSDDAEETLYRVEDSPRGALTWMARFSLYRLYGSLPTETLIRAMTTFDKLIADENIDKEVNLSGVSYYVRALSEEELLTLVKDEPLPLQGIRA